MTELMDMAYRLYDEGVLRSMRLDFALAELQEALARMIDAHKALADLDDTYTLQVINTFAYLTERADMAFQRVRPR